MRSPNDDVFNKKDAFYKFIQGIKNHNLDEIFLTMGKDAKMYSTEHGLSNGRKKDVEFFSGLFNSFPNLFIKPISILYTDEPPRIIVSEVNLGGQHIGILQEILQIVKDF